MHLNKLNTQGFRNLTATELMPHPKVNVISGVNGSGKSSLLEAIYFLAQGRSFRTTQLNRLICQDKEQFVLFGEWQDKYQKLHLGVSRSLSGDGQIRLNGVTLSSHLIATQALPVLLFNPEQFSLLMNSSKARRQLLDWGVFYHNPKFLSHWQTLRKALKQRNAALKQKASASLLAVWDKVLVEAAEAIDAYRTAYVEELLPLFRTLLGEFSIEVQYARGWSSQQSLAQLLAESIEQDRRLGYTHYGPHRADLKLKVQQLPAAEVLSRGQQKRVICALKIAQAQLLATATTHESILLLDDIASEFDSTHAALIFQQLQRLNAQLFITTIDPGQLPYPIFSEPHQHWQMEQGKALIGSSAQT